MIGITVPDINNLRGSQAAEPEGLAGIGQCSVSSARRGGSAGTLAARIED
ncbi:MAG: hypothetical protein IPN76_30825 [Saprospiraceae bacterium]|nr:hypothetical protein [Saprospiraceae bacterium]